MVTLLYETLQSTLEYDTLTRHMCMGDGCRPQLCVENCGQTAAYRDMVTTDRL